MLRKNLLLGLGLLILVALFTTFPAMTQAQGGAGENFIFVNFIGQEVTLNLDDGTYTVPGTNTAPGGGRFTAQLGVGEHKYAVNVPGGPGAAGEFTITPGAVVAKAAELRQGGPVLDQNGIVLEKPKDEVYVFDFNPAAPAAVKTPVVDTWQPRAALPGQGSIVWVNYGGTDELTVDLQGQLYKVPPEANGIPGRLQVDVAPGTYSYTASVPFGSLNGQITMVAGQVIGVDITPGIREEPKYEVGEKVEIPPVKLSQFQEDLTGQVAVSQPDSGPGVLPGTGGELATSPQVETSVQPEGLVVKNFAGETLIFTINNQAYTVADHAEQVLPLPPGSYNYTASLPTVATTGTINLAPGQTVELSVAINIAHDVLSVYQN
jgi:hypothetical protein